MKRSNRLILLFGVALAAMAFVGVLAIGSPSANNQPAEPETVPVVVAVADVPMGTSLSAEMLASDERPTAQATGTFASPDELIGRVVRRTVGAGQVLRDSDFDGAAQQADIGASIGPGLRGIAVALDKVGGVGHLVQAGDRVDVVLTTDTDNTPVTVPNPLYPGSAAEPFILLDDWVNNTSVKVLVQNVQVVAMLHPTVPEGTDPAYENPAEPAQVVAVLAVTPQQVELVRFAQQAGYVSIVMRSPDDATAGEVPTSGITLKQLVDQYGVLPPMPVQP